MKKTSAYARKRAHRVHVIRTYDQWTELAASPTEPMARDTIDHQLTRMWQGLAAIEQAPEPTTDDWRVCSDAVNLMETLTTCGPWLDCSGRQVDVTDESGLLMDANTALAMAGKRHRAGGHIRLDAPGILAVRSILEDYAAILKVLPARTMVRVHRLTEKRISEILAGRSRPHDVEIIDL
jgi:hypothetical protein